MNTVKITQRPRRFDCEWQFERLDGAEFYAPVEFAITVIPEKGDAFSVGIASAHRLSISGIGLFCLSMPENVTCVFKDRQQPVSEPDSNFARPYDRQPISPEMQRINAMQRENESLRRELLDRIRALANERS